MYSGSRGYQKSFKILSWSLTIIRLQKSHLTLLVRLGRSSMCNGSPSATTFTQTKQSKVDWWWPLGIIAASNWIKGNRQFDLVQQSIVCPFILLQIHFKLSDLYVYVLAYAYTFTGAYHMHRCEKQCWYVWYGRAGGIYSKPFLVRAVWGLDHIHYTIYIYIYIHTARHRFPPKPGYGKKSLQTAS